MDTVEQNLANWRASLMASIPVGGCMVTFQYEYDDVWVVLMDKLERWIVENDAELEATKHFPLQD